MSLIRTYRAPGYSAFIAFCSSAISPTWWLHINNVQCPDIFFDQSFPCFDSAELFLDSLNMDFNFTGCSGDDDCEVD